MQILQFANVFALLLLYPSTSFTRSDFYANPQPYANKTLTFQNVSKFINTYGRMNFHKSKSDLDQSRIGYSLLNFDEFHEHGTAGVSFNLQKTRFNRLAESWRDQGYLSAGEKRQLLDDWVSRDRSIIRLGGTENETMTFGIFNFLSISDDRCLVMYAFRKFFFKLDVAEMTEGQRSNMENYVRYRTTEMYNVENEPAIRNLKIQSIRYYGENNNYKLYY